MSIYVRERDIHVVHLYIHYTCICIICVCVADWFYLFSSGFCFYINLPISGAGFAILAFVLKLHNPRTPMRKGLAAVDWLGSLTIIGGTLMVLLGLTLGGVVFPWNSATVVSLIACGGLVACLFPARRVEVRQVPPVIPLRLFNKRASLAAPGLLLLPRLRLHLRELLPAPLLPGRPGRQPAAVGVYILPFSITVAIFSAGSGIFIRKTGRYLPAILFGFVMMTLGFGLLTDLGPTTDWARIVCFQIIAAIGVGPNFQAPLIALQTTVEQRDIASATATFGFIRQLSTSMSVAIGGVVFQNGMQKQLPALMQSLGPAIANLLSGSNAAASVGLVARLPGSQGDQARAAYWNSLRDMYIMYVSFAALGLLVSLFVGQRTLSKDHQEHKTGLKGMEAAAAQAETGKKPVDEEKGRPAGAEKSEEQ